MPRRKRSQAWAIRSVGGSYCDLDWGMGKATLRRWTFGKDLQEVRDKLLAYLDKKCSGQKKHQV